MYSGYSHYNRQTAGSRGTEINDPNNTWFQQEPHWILIEDLLGGTYQMRSRHRKYLMQETSELALQSFRHKGHLVQILFLVALTE